MSLEINMKLEVRNISRRVASRSRAPMNPFTPTLSQQEMNKLADEVDDRRDRAVILFLMDTGARVGEFVALDRDMIAVGAGVIPGSRISTAATCSLSVVKSTERRTLYVSGRALEALTIYLESREDTNPALFATRSGERLRSEQVRKLVHKSCDRLGIKRFPLHEFRRCLIARICGGGGNPYTILSAMGHTMMKSSFKVFRPLDLQVD